jgi:hypothetical protein
MEYGRFRCRHCCRLQWRRSGNQRYCSDEACQRARRNTWRREKYATDPDYRANQRASSEAWLAAQGGVAAWYRDYRRRRRDEAVEPLRHRPSAGEGEVAPDIAATGLAAAATHEGQEAKRGAACANSDADSQESHVISGQYRLIAVGGANSDAILVELSVISND